MAKKVFAMYLAKEGNPNSDAYAKLDLPASPWELWDALEKVRLQTDDILYMEIEDYFAFAYLTLHLDGLETTRSTICSSAWRVRTSKTCSASAAVIRRGRCTGCSTTPIARATSPTRGIQAILKRRGGMSRRAVRAFWHQFKIKTCKVRKAGLWPAFLHLFGVLNNFYRGCSEFVKNFHSGITRFA